MKLGCIGVGARCDELLRSTESPYFSKGEVFLGSLRTFSTACQVFIFIIFLNFFNKFFLKIFISFIFYFLLYFNIRDYKKSNISCNKFHAKLFDTSSWPVSYGSKSARHPARNQ